MTLDEHTAELTSHRNKLTRQLNRLFYLRVYVAVVGIAIMALALMALEEGLYPLFFFQGCLTAMNFWNFQRTLGVRNKCRDLRDRIDRLLLEMRETYAELHQPQS